MTDSMWKLEAAAALGWQPTERAQLGEWLLRAAEGFTGRANSALPLGQPDRPIPEAVDAVRQWYLSRGLTPSIVIPHPLAGPAGEPLDEFLADQGWPLRDGPAVVMTASVDRIAGSGDRPKPVSDPPESARRSPADLTAAGPIEMLTRPDPGWLALYRYRGTAAPPVATRLLVSAPWQAFAVARRDGATVAIGRISVAAGWAGLTAIEVAPAYQRQGLAGAVIATLARHAAAKRGVERVYVQVQEDNLAGHALYTRCGFTENHRYHYRMGPPQ